jgi:hypothetical protein
MTAKAALCYHLLKGDILTIGSGFKILGITNLPREIGRGIERDTGPGCHGFGVKVSKTNVDGRNRYNNPVNWFQYRLNKTDYNAPGIEKMKAYLREQVKGHPDEKKFLTVCNPNLF